jgi:selenoprotein W-related protein
LAAEVRERYPEATVRLIESSGGLFEVQADGNLVFSKKALGRHAEPGEVVRLIEQRRAQERHP